MVFKITRFAGFKMGFELFLAAFVEIISVIIIIINKKPLKIFKKLPKFLVHCRFAPLEAVFDDGRPFPLLLITKQSKTFDNVELTRCGA